MAQITYRANLSAAVFPFIAEDQGRSIIVKGPDQNFVQTITSKEDMDKDIGIPQVYYCHNVMPSGNGYISVGYNTKIQEISPTELTFREVITVIDDTGNKALLGITSAGKVYVYTVSTPAWTLDGTVAGAAGKQVTKAYVNGVTYIYFSGVGCYTFNFGTGHITAQTLTGLTPSNVLGICEANGYMIAWTASAIAWSSTLDPTDFTPDTVTGAGGGSVEGARGALTVCASTTNGFIIYTTQNAVAASYSGNARYPYNYKALASSGGVGELSKIGSDANSAAHYAYTTSGLQVISLAQASNVFPEVTDFLAGSYFEDFDEATLTFTRLSLSHVMQKRISVVSDRYLVISYGISEYTHALVYDTATKRFGKLKQTHVAMFEFQLLNPEVVETPRDSLAMLTKSGKVLLLELSFAASSSNGVVILGKFQYARSRLMQLDNVDVENIPEFGTFKLYDMFSLDGKNVAAQECSLLETNGVQRYYGVRKTGVNHSIACLGSFSLTSLLLTFNVHGRR